MAAVSDVYWIGGLPVLRSSLASTSGLAYWDNGLPAAVVDPTIVTLLTVTAVETVTATENLRAVLPVVTVHATESITATENLRAVLPGLTVFVADSLTATENLRAVLPVVSVHAAESVTVTENLHIVLPVLTVTAVDPITVIDSLHPVLPVLAVAVADSITVTETRRVGGVVSRQVTDTVTVISSTAPAIHGVLKLVVADSITIAPAGRLQASLWVRPAAATVTVTESVLAIVAVRSNVAAVENVALTELVATRLTPLVVRVADLITTRTYTQTSRTTKRVLDRIALTESVRLRLGGPLTARVFDPVHVTEGSLNPTGAGSSIGPAPSPVVVAGDYWVIGI